MGEDDLNLLHNEVMEWTEKNTPPLDCPILVGLVNRENAAC